MEQEHSVFSYSFVIIRLIFTGIFLLPIVMFLAPALTQANSVSVSIQSLSPSNSISVNTPISFSVAASGFTNPSYAISDSFSGGTVSNSNINSSGNFSWTPSSSDVGTHTLTITVTDSSGDTGTTIETVTVTPAASISIQSLSPSSSVSVGTNVTFSAAVTGFNSPSFSVSDSFNGSSISSGDINSSGNFSWTPTTQDVGTHTINVTANDSSGHNSSASETITVNSAATVLIQSLSPGTTVNVGQNVSFNVSVSGFNSPNYSVSDSFGGSSVSNGDINSSGNFNWTPNSNDAGTHTITAIVTDGSGHTATASQTIVVEAGGVSIGSLSPGQTTVLGTPVSFVVNASGFTNPTYTLSDSFQGSTVSNADINSSGNFSWTPTSADFGAHNITVHVSDNYGHSGNATQEITIENPSITIESISPSQSISPGTNLSFFVAPIGFTSPNYSVSDTFPGTSLSSVDINSSGYFNWTPLQSDGGTHYLTITATDPYSHSANATLTINVGSVQNPLTTIAPQTGYEFTEYLVVGSSDAQVTALQTFLTREGLFSGPITGYYGPLTQTAVENFQTAHGIDPVGTIGPLTRNVLNELDGTGTTVTGTTEAESGCAAGNIYSTTTGQLCSTITAPIPGCAAGDTYSTTTGQFCGTATETVVSTAVTTTPTTSGYQFENLLQIGSTGEDVTELQDRLTNDGIYSGPITGYYGTLTEAAVEIYQSRHGIEAVGYVGPSTRAELNSGL